MASALFPFRNRELHSLACPGGKLSGYDNALNRGRWALYRG
ncbi:Uncharacterised protein [Vibrio cholerae]|nr:Uncharacterised protein [Vibrio cholerae]